MPRLPAETPQEELLAPSDGDGGPGRATGPSPLSALELQTEVTRLHARISTEWQRADKAEVRVAELEALLIEEQESRAAWAKRALASERDAIRLRGDLQSIALAERTLEARVQRAICDDDGEP